MNNNYMMKYLKNNAVVLVCELIVVLLLSLICTIILGGQPMWLAPTLAVVAYFLAELRFMMAYVASNTRRDRATEGKPQASAEAATDEPVAAPEQIEDEADEDEAVVPAPVTEQKPVEEPKEAPAQSSIDMDDEDEAVDALFTTPVEQAEKAADDKDDKAAPVAMESIDDDADFTMEDGADEQQPVRDELDIGEIGEAK